MGKLIDEVSEGKGMRSPKDKMIRSREIITKRHERRKETIEYES